MFSEEFYLSRDTVEKAYSILKERNIITSIRGKGFYITRTKLISKVNILFLVNKLSSYKMRTYNHFVNAIGANSHIDLHIYHCDETLFLNLLDKNKSAYDYYVIMPHFKTEQLTHISFTENVIEAIKKIIDNQSIYLIEDASHAHGGKFAGAMLGNLSDIGIFSLQGSKAVAGGEGGLALTNNEELFLKMSLFGHFDRHASQFHKINADDFKHIGFGHKYRMAPISALIADGDLRYLDKVNALMQKAAAMFDQAFSSIEGVKFARFSDQGVRGGFCNGYPLYITKPGVTGSQAIEALQLKGINASLYPFPLHHKLASYNQPALRKSFNGDLTTSANKPEPDAVLPVTEKLASQLILLPRRYLITLSKKKLDVIKATLSSL